MSVHRSILAGAGFWCLLALGAYHLWPAGRSERPAAPAGAPSTQAAPRAVPLLADVRPPAADHAPREPVSAMVRYPDGSEARSLNGVTEPMAVTWPDRIPFTPIVGTFRDGPPHYWEWYVHEDGTQSTVAMFRLQPDAEPVPTSLIRHPQALGPMRAVGDGRFVSGR